jgi:hypothetical protein
LRFPNAICETSAISHPEELYKSLLEESLLYREKVSTIWLQKFTMNGGIIAFAAARIEPSAAHQNLTAVAFLSLPVIAILLDLKLGEFGIHARIIDGFIIRNFPDPKVMADWERTKWGLQDSPDRPLVRFRSIATVAVTIVPTCIIGILSVLAAKPFLPSAVYTSCLVGWIGLFSPLHLLAGLKSGSAVLFRASSSSRVD